MRYTLSLPFVLLSLCTHAQTNSPPVYDVGEIPDQRILYNSEAENDLVFDLVAGALGESATITASFNASTLPDGLLTFDEELDRFTYQPTATDKDAFKATFLAVGDGAPIVQEVLIEPIQPLPPESNAFGTLPDPATIPDPESRDYLLIDDVMNNDSISFNESDAAETRSVSIVGKRVVFEAGHPSDLYETYHALANLKDLEIHAEHLIIRETLEFPQTALSIYAHKITFEDTEGEDPVSISTTPLDPDGGIRPPRDGDGDQPKAKNGRLAGAIILAVKELEAAGDSIRFIAKGGTGQPGINGAAGAPLKIRSALSRNQSVSIFNTPVNLGVDNALFVWWSGTTVTAYRPDKANYEGSVSWGTRLLDPDGNYFGRPGKPGGIPGDGGDGGDIQTNLAIDTLVDNSGGSAGAHGAVGAGGRSARVHKNGDTSTLYSTGRRIKINLNIFGSVTGNSVATFTAGPPGSNAAPPPAEKPIGNPGSYEEQTDSLTWLSPSALRILLSYLNDAYFEGHLGLVDKEAARYVGMVEDAANSSAWTGNLDETTRNELVQIKDDMLTLRHRIASNLDFFGNPAGWVPMLSFEVNKLAFDNEIDRALRVMYLNYWLGNIAADLASKKEAMKALRTQLIEQIKDDRDAYTDAVEEIPTVEAQAALLQAAIDAAIVRIQEIEDSLLQKAKNIVVLKKTARTLGKIAQTIPVYQPALGAAGGAVAASADIDPNKSWEANAILVGTGTAQGFANGAASAKAKGAQSAANGINTSDTDEGTDNSASIEAMQAAKEPLMMLLQESFATMTAEKGADPEVEAELQRLLADVPEFRSLKDDLYELNIQKREFIIRLTDLLQKITTLPIAIERSLSAIEIVNLQLLENSEQLNPETIAYLQDMNSRARARLQKYMYFMAKAYTYRRLEAYPGSLAINDTFDKLQELATTNDFELDADNFDSLKAVYESEVAKVAEAILNEANENVSEKSISVIFDLPQEVLDTLNRGETARINLKDLNLFPLSEENLRITRLFATNISMSTDPNRPTPNSADLVFQHSGDSELQQAGKTFLFRHYNQNTRSRIQWKTRYFFSNGIIVPEEPSEAQSSLINALVPGSQNLLIYSRPAARADLLISIDSSANPESIVFLNSATIEVQYDFTQRDQNLKFLRFQNGENGLNSLVKIDVADRNEREDGLGDFERVYDLNTNVTVEAPATIGDLKFVRWEGVTLDNPTLASQTFTLSRDYNLRPVYEPAFTYQLTVDEGTGSGTYPAGETVTITANDPGKDRKFSKWIGGSPVDPFAATTEVPVLGDETITAQFAITVDVGLEISSITHKGNNLYELAVRGNSLSTFTVQNSTDLNNWTTQQTTQLVNGLATIDVQIVDGEFYRLTRTID